MPSTPCRVAFFSLPAQRKEPKERAALPLRRPRSTGCGTGGARTRCAQTACPFLPVPHPAARLSAKGLFFFPGNPPCPARSSWRGQPSTSRAGIPRGSFPRSSVRLCCRSPTITLNHHRGHGPLLPKNPAPAVRAGPARDTHPPKKKKGATSTSLAPDTPRQRTVSTAQQLIRNGTTCAAP